MANDYDNRVLDGVGLGHLWAKMKAAFAATSHTHAIADVTSLQTTLDGKAPTSHASSGSDYGAGTGSSYGHVKLSDSTSSTSAASGGTAATPKAVKDALDSAKAYADSQAVEVDSFIDYSTTNPSRNPVENAVIGVALSGKAASSHAHGNITSGGDITATAPTVASGDKLIINDESASKITNGPSFGTSTTQFLANNGTWQTPAGTTYSDFTGATASAAGAHGLVPAPSRYDADSILMGNGYWADPHLGYSQPSGGDDVQINLGADYINSGGSVSVLFDTITIPAATAGASGVMSGADKSKLSGIEAGANNYTHPSYTAANAAAVKVGRDATGHVVTGDALTAADVGASATGHKHAAGDITSGTLDVARGGTGASTLGAGVVYHSASGTGALSIATAANLVSAIGNSAVNRATADASGNNIADTYAKKSDLTGLFTYKGSKADASSLPSSGNSKGDVWNIEAASIYGPAGTNVAWDGSAWDALGGLFSLDSLTTADIDAICV